MLVEEYRMVEEPARQVRQGLCATHACPIEILLGLVAEHVRQVSLDWTSGGKRGWRAAPLDPRWIFCAKLEKKGSTWFAKKGKSPTQLEVGVDSAQPVSRFLQKLSHRLAKLMWIKSELSPRSSPKSIVDWKVLRSRMSWRSS